jgi:hypothetical protein
MIHHDKAVSEAYRQVLIQKAGLIVKKYPQYRGKFDDNLLIRFKTDYEGFKEGNFSLAEPKMMEYFGSDGRCQCIPVWNFEKGWFVYVPYAAIDFVECCVKLTLELDY